MLFYVKVLENAKMRRDRERKPDKLVVELQTRVVGNSGSNAIVKERVGNPRTTRKPRTRSWLSCETSKKDCERESVLVR
jgi:hypothetical protein